MKLKSLLVITLFVVACSFASAQSFGFASIGSGLYCDFEQLSYAGGGLWGGSDNLSACGLSVNASISGFSSTVANKGEAAHGAGVVYGDSVYAVTSGNPFLIWTVFTKLKCNAVNSKTGLYKGAPGWEGVATFYGVEAGTNDGFLSCSLPSKNGKAPLKGMSTHQKN